MMDQRTALGDFRAILTFIGIVCEKQYTPYFILISRLAN